MFKNHVKPGMNVLDTGCGGGFASIGLAELVGENGSVTSVDLQQEMLDFMIKRATKKGVENRIIPHKCEKDRIGLSGSYDFVNAFYMVDEVPNTETFLKEIYTLMNTGARLFIAEPRFHVTTGQFQSMIRMAQKTGLSLKETPKIRFSKAVIFSKN